MPKTDYKVYSEESTEADTYQQMQTQQTKARVAFFSEVYKSQSGTKDKQSGCVIRMRLMDAMDLLSEFIDKSDPDAEELPQIYHAGQTALACKNYLADDGVHLKPTPIRSLFTASEWEELPLQYQRDFSTADLASLYPDIDDWAWFPLIGFIHDLGKVLATERWGALPQAFVVGDTFPIGAPFSRANVFYDQGFFKANPDLTVTDNASNHHGRYREHCGFDQVTMSFGHDDYLKHVLDNNIHHLPDIALYLIDKHSFYPWHTPANGKRGYSELASHQDYLNLPLLKAFHNCDLYSKTTETLPDIQAMKEEYQALMDRFIPGRHDTPYNLRPYQFKW